MNGYSSHTYMWINADGERFWVKYHFKTDQGIEFFTQDEGDQMAAVDTDYHQRDLYEHIEAGEFPSWTLNMQIMPFEDAKTYRFNPFDLTKVWPHGDYPLHEVGRLTLNRNVTDYHTEMEQAAFEPNNLVAGTGLSPDKMLLARGFCYADAHRARLGVNYKQIPVNSPQVAGAQLLQGRRDAGHERQPTRSTRRTPTAARRPTRRCTDDGGTWYSDGEMVRTAYTLRAEDDDWGQAGTMVREVLDDAARDRLVDNIVGHLLNGVSEPVLLARVRVLAQRRQGPRRPDRAGRARQAGREGPEGRRAGQPGPVEHAGQGLNAAAPTGRLPAACPVGAAVLEGRPSAGHPRATAREDDRTTTEPSNFRSGAGQRVDGRRAARQRGAGRCTRRDSPPLVRRAGSGGRRAPELSPVTRRRNATVECRRRCHSCAGRSTRSR